MSKQQSHSQGVLYLTSEVTGPEVNRCVVSVSGACQLRAEASKASPHKVEAIEPKICFLVIKTWCL